MRLLWMVNKGIVVKKALMVERARAAMVKLRVSVVAMVAHPWAARASNRLRECTGKFHPTPAYLTPYTGSGQQLDQTNQRFSQKN